MTQTEITTELTAIAAAILRITGQKTISTSVGGRQTAFEGAGKLTALYARQGELEARLARLQRNGTTGIPGRSGVLR